MSQSTKFEYLVVLLDGRNEEKLNALGEQGWELVSVTPESPDVYATAYLKRSKS